MKTFIKTLMSLSILFAVSCEQKTDSAVAPSPDGSSDSSQAVMRKQEDVTDDVSNPNIVQVAASNSDFSTLVAAVKAADLAGALSNPGPFTVFAPTNAAFDKLPAGTVDELLKPEKKNDLVDILGYHTYVGVLKPEGMRDGQKLGMVTPKNVEITKDGDKVFVNGHEIVASVEASNGIIHVINEVLLPN